MNRILYVIILLFFSNVHGQLPKSIQKKSFKEVKGTFNVDAFQLENQSISGDIQKMVPSSFTSENFYKIIAKEKLVGYAYHGTALGKTDLFDFLILFDSELIILKSKVLIYREDYGGEIGSKRWLKQFEGKDYRHQFDLKKDVVAISGATLSVRAMSSAINDVLKSIRLIIENQGL